MSSGEVNGKTLGELEEHAQNYYDSSKYAERDLRYEEVFCLAEIRQQPDEYEGPQRYCSNYSVQLESEPSSPEQIAPKCRLHGGANTSETADGDLDCIRVNHNNEAVYIKHGMYSSDEHLEEYFTEADQKLYNFIMSWAEAYGIDEEQYPGDYDMLQQLAVERVRSARSAKYLLEEEEAVDSPVFDAQGNLVAHEDASNALSEEHQRQRKLIMKFMKELNLTPKERARTSTDEKEADASKMVAEMAKEAINSGDNEYDPDDYE